MQKLRIATFLTIVLATAGAGVAMAGGGDGDRGKHRGKGKRATATVLSWLPRFVVDFGCGRNDFIRELRRRGVDGPT